MDIRVEIYVKFATRINVQNRFSIVFLLFHAYLIFQNDTLDMAVWCVVSWHYGVSWHNDVSWHYGVSWHNDESWHNDANGHDPLRFVATAQRDVLFICQFAKTECDRSVDAFFGCVFKSLDISENLT